MGRIATITLEQLTQAAEKLPAIAKAPTRVGFFVPVEYRQFFKEMSPEPTVTIKNQLDYIEFRVGQAGVKNLDGDVVTADAWIYEGKLVFIPDPEDRPTLHKNVYGKVIEQVYAEIHRRRLDNPGCYPLKMAVHHDTFAALAPVDRTIRGIHLYASDSGWRHLS